jgi:hypothetical protein
MQFSIHCGGVITRVSVLVGFVQTCFIQTSVVYQSRLPRGKTG